MISAYDKSPETGIAILRAFVLEYFIYDYLGSL